MLQWLQYRIQRFRRLVHLKRSIPLNDYWGLHIGKKWVQIEGGENGSYIPFERKTFATVIKELTSKEFDESTIHQRYHDWKFSSHGGTIKIECFYLPKHSNEKIGEFDLSYSKIEKIQQLLEDWNKEDKRQA